MQPKLDWLPLGRKKLFLCGNDKMNIQKFCFLIFPPTNFPKRFTPFRKFAAAEKEGEQNF